MKTRRLGLSALVLAVSALAVAADRHLSGSQNSAVPVVPRPEAAHPGAASPSAEYLALQERAIRQPSGRLTEEAVPVVPEVALPRR